MGQNKKKPSTWVNKQLLGKNFYVFTEVWVPFYFGFLDTTLYFNNVKLSTGNTQTTGFHKGSCLGKSFSFFCSKSC